MTIAERGRHDLRDVACGSARRRAGAARGSTRAARPRRPRARRRLGGDLDLDARRPWAVRPDCRRAARPGTRDRRRPCVSGQAASRSARVARPEGVEDRLGEDLAEHARPARSPAPPTSRTSSDQRAPRPAAATPAVQRHAEQRGQEQPGEHRERLGRPLGPLVEVGDLVGPLGTARGRRSTPPAGSASRTEAPWSSAIETRCRTRTGRPRTSITDPGSARPRALAPVPSPAGPSAAPTRGNVFVSPSRARNSSSRRRIAPTSASVVVVIAAQMKQSVDHVEGQLGQRVGARPRSAVAAAISAETTSSPASSGSSGVGEQEADHVGRPVVAEVPAVDPVDGRVVDQRDRDRRALDSLVARGRARPARRGRRDRPRGSPGCR